MRKATDREQELAKRLDVTLFALAGILDGEVEATRTATTSDGTTYTFRLLFSARAHGGIVVRTMAIDGQRPQHEAIWADTVLDARESMWWANRNEWHMVTAIDELRDERRRRAGWSDDSSTPRQEG